MSFSKLFSCLACAALIPISAAICSQASAPLAAEASYRLGPGDVIDVRVTGRPQLTAEALRIGEDGKIRVAMIDHPLTAACKTEQALEEEIKKEYSQYLVEPQVSVSVRQFSSRVVNLGGAVLRPGGFELQRRVKLREVLTLAGGTAPAAGDTVTIVRDENHSACEQAPPGTEGVKTINLPALLAGDPASNPYILPGDFIRVSEADEAFVVGNVPRPAPIPLSQPTTLMRALALAGGRLPGSKDRIQIIRHESGPQSKLTVLNFSWKDLLANRAEDPMVRPGDIVDVDMSLSKALAKAGMASLVSAGVVYFPITYIK